MSVLTGGGSGFIGRHLTKLLTDNGMKVTILSRSAGPNRITWSELQRSGLPEGYSAVVNMSGENILNPLKKWNESFKQTVWSSRVDCTQSLARAICQSSTPPKVFVSMSGVGYDKPDSITEYTEESPGGDFDYLSELCTAWEAAAKLPSTVPVRQVTVRCGVVLGRDGGMIQQIYYPFLFGLGGPLGSGQQWFPWIHIKDIVDIFFHAIISESATGVLNGVAPQPLTRSSPKFSLPPCVGRL